MPYIFNSAKESSTDGLPMMRAMLLEFPEDPAVEMLDRQYMFGDSLLVAPVFNEEGEVSVYVPKGKWMHLLTNEKIEGGSWRVEKHDYLSLPLYVRPNSIIALGAVDTKPDYDFTNGVELHLFELEEGKTASAAVRNPQAEVELEVSATREGDKIHVSTRISAGKPWTLVLRGISEVTSIVDGMMETTELGVKVTPERGQGTFSITL